MPCPSNRTDGHPSTCFLRSRFSTGYSPACGSSGAGVFWLLLFMQRQLGSLSWPQVSTSGAPSSEPLPVSGHKPGKGISSVSSGFAASRLDTMMAALRMSGFSEDSLDVSRQAHRESTIRQYQTIWTYFLDFLARNGLSCSEVSEATVCNFLSFHAKTFGRKYHTLSTYKSALRHPIYLACGVDINGLISNFFWRGLQFQAPSEG